MSQPYIRLFTSYMNQHNNGVASLYKYSISGFVTYFRLESYNIIISLIKFGYEYIGI